jgi:hypothetical protein
MSRDLTSSLAISSIFAILPLVGCVCPPCAAGAAAAPTAQGGGEAPAAANAPLAAGGLIWNGDGAGEGAKGWADCDKKPDCKAKLEPTPGAGKDGSVGLKFEGEGAGFVGMGWNWFGWWPETGGTDVSGEKTLTFSIRIVAPSPDVAPDLNGTTLSLGCSKGKKNSASVPLGAYAKDALDGKWHQVTIPLADLQKGEGKELDLKTVWEFRVGTWAASPRKFEIYVDDIAFGK